MSPADTNASHLDRLILNHDPDPHQDGGSHIYRIGDLAREFGVTLRTLRFYEDRDLITPKRMGSTRLYSEDDRSRLKLILLAKRVGFSLIDIQEIMEIYDMGSTSDRHLRVVLDKFKAQMLVLGNQKQELDDSISELRDTINSLEDML